MSKDEALARLREVLQPGATVYTILRHVSASGMTRWISPIVIRDGQPFDLTHLVRIALGWPASPKHEGLKVGGSGMDMGFHLVYSIGQGIFTGEDVPESAYHRAPGYLLTQRWL